MQRKGASRGAAKRTRCHCHLLYGGPGEDGTLQGHSTSQAWPIRPERDGAALGMDKLATSASSNCRGPVLPRSGLDASSHPRARGPLHRQAASGQFHRHRGSSRFSDRRASSRSDLHLRRGAVIEPYRAISTIYNCRADLARVELSAIERPSASARARDSRLQGQVRRRGGMHAAPREIPAKVSEALPIA